MSEEDRSLVCRRGATARAKVYEGGKLVNPDVRPDFPFGQCVVHDVYGLGKIVAERGEGLHREIGVHFEKYGLKSFVLVYVKHHLRPEDAPI